jgi:transcription initiation factor TFIIB
MSLVLPEGNDAVCKPCFKQGRGVTKVVVDHTMGDLICTSCGLVLASQLIDESQEWRNFASDSVDYGMKVNSRMRGGDADNAMDMFDNMKGTAFSGKGDEDLNRAQTEVDRKSKSFTPEERGLQNVMDKARRFVSQLRLSEIVTERCLHFMNVLSKSNRLGRGHKAPWYYAVIYLACREENMGRTIRELAHSGADNSDNPVSEEDFEKQMSKCISRLRNALGSELRQGQKTYIDPEELAHRYVGKLQLSAHLSSPVAHFAKQAHQLRKTNVIPAWCSSGGDEEQSAIIMSAISVVAYLSEVPDSDRPSLDQLSSVAKISPNSIARAYEVLRPYIEGLLPEALRTLEKGQEKTLSRLDSLPQTIRPPPARLPVVPIKSGANIPVGR